MLPMRVSPILRASSTEKLVATAVLASSETPMRTVLSRISEATRPVDTIILSSVGVPSRKHSPTIMSMALCRPMSSRKSSISVGVQSDELWQPRVRPYSVLRRLSSLARASICAGVTLSSEVTRRLEMVATLRSKLVPLPQPEVMERCISRPSAQGSWLTRTRAVMRPSSSRTSTSSSCEGSVNSASDLRKPTARCRGCFPVQSRVTTSRSFR